MIRAGFGFGNERTVTRFNGGEDGVSKYGNFVSKTDRFGLLLDLMNDGKEEKSLWIKMIYEVVEGEAAEGYRQATALRLDAGACGSSEIEQQPHGQWQVSSKPWVSKVEGKMLYASGHMHDGGTNITMYKNGEVICVSEQLYDRRAGYREPAGSAHPGQKHISDAGICTNFNEVNVGDKLHITAHYDSDKYPPTQHAGEAHLHANMGLVFIFIGPK